MRKFIFNSFMVLSLFLLANVYAQNDFTKSLRTCEKYSQLGGAEAGGQYYNILITLDKNKKSCIYKEKIYQSSGYQLLTCNFAMDELNSIADNMDKFVNTYKKEISKNKIFEAKLTNCGTIFENYLINPKYCKITMSKTK